LQEFKEVSVQFQSFNDSKVSSLSLLHACRLHGLSQAKEAAKRYESPITSKQSWKNQTFFGKYTPEGQREFEAAQTALGSTLYNINQLKLFCHVLGSDLDLITPNSGLYASKNKILSTAELLDALPSVTIAANTFRELNEEVSRQNRMGKLIAATTFPIDNASQMADAFRKHTQLAVYSPRYVEDFPRETAFDVLKLMIYAKANRREKELTESVKTVLGTKPELMRLMQAFEQPLVCLNPSSI
jgi:hypothetical protein